jgi:FkbM family methyltransferase
MVDVGANFGHYTCLASTRGIPVVAIEPLPSNLRVLYQNIRDNRLRDVQVHPVAVGAEPGLLTLFGSGTGASLIEGWAGASRQTVVPVHTLDSILTGGELLGRRLLIKMDVEGAELAVLSGATRTLAAEATWMLEVNYEHHHPSGRNPDFAEIFERFWASGYTATALEGGRKVTREDVSRWLRQDARDFGGHNYGFART